MKSYLFIDESGDHGLRNLSPDFPLFLLCGVLIQEEQYLMMDKLITNLKRKHWGNKEVILHSRDIRKCEKEFQILFDLEIKKQFYQELNSIISSNDYLIVASAIQKEKFIENFGKLHDDVYEVALSFIIERTVLILQERNISTELSIVIEKRGKKEDNALFEHFQRLTGRGTGKVSADALNSFTPTFIFKNKMQNINGLQLADLLAYPIARNVIEPNRANPAYDVFANKIYSRNGNLKGLKIYP